MKLFLQKYDIYVVAFVAAILLLANLGNQYLWQDEAQTALISKTILERGLPYGTDGKNFFSQELGAEYGENYIWKWHTWFPFYIQAFFFWLFGTSNFVARLPFALFGVGSVIYTFLLAKKLFKEDKIALISVVLLLTNVGFLVLSRQARLYSPSMMLTTASLYYFIKLKDDDVSLSLSKTRLISLYFVLCTTLLFHTHYFYYATFFISIGLYLVLVERCKIKRFVLPTIISGLINLPWMIWFRDLKYQEQYHFNFNKYILFNFFKSYSYSIYRHFLSEWAIFILIFIFILITAFNFSHFKNKLFKNYQALFLLLLYSGVSIVFLCFFTPLDNFRYLGALYSSIIIIIAFLFFFVYNYNKYLSIILLSGFILMNSFGRYIYEITHDYDGPLEGITNYLNEHAQPDDVVLITYGDIPVKWYTNLRTYGGLTGEDLTPAKDADWVIYRKYTACEKDSLVKAFIDENIRFEKYKKIQLPFPDYEYENREDPLKRIFYPQKEDNVFIYKKLI